MPDYLSKKDWRTLLKKKEHKDIKKTGISDTLTAYASAVKKKDLGKQVSTLEAIIAKAREVKSNHKTVKSLTGYLDDMITEAQKKEKGVSDQLDQIDDDSADNPLAKDLKKLKTISESNSWNFVAAPGRPSTGLVVRKKSILKAQIKEALAMKGKPGPFFMGKVYGGGGKIVFELEAQPPKGLAKSIKRGAKLHAQIDIKVLVKGGGVEFDDEHDIEPEAEESAPTFSGKSSYPSGSDWKQIVDRVGKLPPERRVAEIEGLRGRVGRMSGEIKRDDSLSDTEKDGQQQLLDAVLEALVKIDLDLSGTKTETFNYPTRQDWRDLADKIVRLDAAKQKEGEELFDRKTDQVHKKLKSDTALSKEDRKEHQDNLDRATRYFMGAMKKARTLTESMQKQDVEMQGRFLKMERDYTEIGSSDFAKNVDVAKLLESFRTLRGAFRSDNVEKVTATIDGIERSLQDAVKLVRLRAQNTATSDDQDTIYDTISPQLKLVKKAAFASDAIYDAAKLKKDMKKDGPLRTLVEDAIACEKSASTGALDKLEDSSRDYLKVCAQRK
ncbi:MAG: hypothetical protein AAF317_06810, partial [Pseudomonadota bacterium]